VQIYPRRPRLGYYPATRTLGFDGFLKRETKGAPSLPPDTLSLRRSDRDPVRRP